MCQKGKQAIGIRVNLAAMRIIVSVYTYTLNHEC